ncbi:MAG: hypothetical protein PHE84_07050 [bacterium]|nr:hypothetical protein [bacterium]
MRRSRPGSAVFSIILFSLLLMLSWARTARADSIDQAVAATIEKTKNYSTADLQALTPAEKAKFEKGEPVIRLIKVEGEGGGDRENFAKTVVLLDADPEVVYEVLVDLANYPKYFSSVKKTVVFERGKENGLDYQIYLQQVHLPVIPDVYAYIKLFSQKVDGNGDGKTDKYLVWWVEDDRKLLQDEKGKDLKPNLKYNYGSWNVQPYEGKSLIFYHEITSPNFWVPKMAWTKANTWVGIPQVLEDLQKSARLKKQK